MIQWFVCVCAHVFMYCVISCKFTIQLLSAVFFSQAWLTEIHEFAQQNVVIMLLGNKVSEACPGISILNYRSDTHWPHTFENWHIMAFLYLDVPCMIAVNLLMIHLANMIHDSWFMVQQIRNRSQCMMHRNWPIDCLIDCFFLRLKSHMKGLWKERRARN